jgi:hypothetical protein
LNTKIEGIYFRVASQNISMARLREQGFGVFHIVHENLRGRLLRKDRTAYQVKIHAE